MKGLASTSERNKSGHEIVAQQTSARLKKECFYPYPTAATGAICVCGMVGVGATKKINQLKKKSRKYLRLRVLQAVWILEDSEICSLDT